MPSSVYLHDGEKQITVRFPTEEDRERFKAHYRALDALAVQFLAEREELRGEVAALREGYRWILGAANAVQEGKTSEAVALIAIEDFANYSLAAARRCAGRRLPK